MKIMYYKFIIIIVLKIKFPGGVYPGPVLESLVYLGNVGLTLPIALRNIYRSYRDVSI